MRDVGDNMKKSLLKQQEALNRFRARKDAFLLAKEQLTKEFEEARNLWISTVDQLPNREFNQHHTPASLSDHEKHKYPTPASLNNRKKHK